MSEGKIPKKDRHADGANTKGSYNGRDHQTVATIPQRRTEQQKKKTSDNGLKIVKPPGMESYNDHDSDEEYDSNSMDGYDSDLSGQSRLTWEQKEEIEAMAAATMTKLLQDAIIIHNPKQGYACDQTDVLDGRLKPSSASDIEERMSIVEEDFDSENREEPKQTTITKTPRYHGASPTKAKTSSSNNSTTTDNTPSKVGTKVVALTDEGFVPQMEETWAPVNQSNTKEERPTRKSADDANAKIIAQLDEGSLASTEDGHTPTPSRISKSLAPAVSSKRLRSEDPRVPVQTNLECPQARTKLSETDMEVDEVHENDVVCFESNEMYNAMIMKYARLDGRTITIHAIVKVITESIYKQSPPGRFIRVEDETPRLLQKEAIFEIIKDAIALGKQNLKASVVKVNRQGVKRKTKTGSREEQPTAEGREVEMDSLESAESNEKKTSLKTERPSLDVRDTDVFPSKLPGRGNDFFLQSLSKYTPADDQYVFVDKVITAIHAQEPPGRFLTPDKQSVLTGAAEQLRVWKSLQSRMQISKPECVVHEIVPGGESSTQEPSGPKVDGLSTALLESAAWSSSFVPHDNDVLTGPEAEKVKNAGNVLFQELIAHNVDTLDLSKAVDIILREINAQIPPGRFWSKNGCSSIVRGTAETVAVYDKLTCARRQASLEVRETDVGGLDGIVQLTDGVRLFRSLLSDHDRSKDRDSAAEDIIAAIHAQNPLGRFWSNENTFILDERMEKFKVINAVHNIRNTSVLDLSLQNNSDHVAKQKKLASDHEARESEMLQQRCDLPDVPPATYIEDVAWRAFAVHKESMEDIKPLPPPSPLPPLPTDCPEATCKWNFDASSRILRVKLKPGVKRFSCSDKWFLQTMMERDDIAVITEGHCDILESRYWSLGYIKSKGDKYHHRFRHFKRTRLTDRGNTGKVECEEKDKDVCMKVQDYVDYLRRRSEAIEHEKETREEDACSDLVESGQSATKFTYNNEANEPVTLDLLKDNIYMLDYDIKKQLPAQYKDFKDNFYFPEFLPGGAKCLMSAVNEAARPDMGPNLYITPPGTFTRFHQDGFGTVDSGHLCISGYNEVVMFRRLPPGHDRNAISTEGSTLYEMPHADKLGKTALDWPTKARIKALNEMNYCPIVLLLGPGELLHIGKGRFHAFRKLGAESLGVDDCHFDLRNALHAKLRGRGEAVEQLLNMSLAWDWSYAGVSPEGVNREIASTLEFALRNRNLSEPRQSLAIPKMSLIASCDDAISYLEENAPARFEITIGNVNEAEKKRNYNMLKGLLPTLEFVVRKEQDAYDLAATSGTDIFHINFWPNSWENSVTFPLDPFGNSDYFCKVCYQELPNAYMHCNGCEDLLTKDLNVCIDCHAGLMHQRFVGMSARSQDQDSAWNHTGQFKAKKRKSCKCEDAKDCISCHRCRTCSCTCHQNFSLHQRMWDNEKLSYVLAKAKNIVGDDKIEYFDEVQHRLRQALEFRPAGEHKKVSAVITHSQQRKQKDNLLASPPLALQHFEVQPYHYIESETVPTSHLDISRAAMAFTAPLSGFVTPFIGGTKFDAISILQLEEFVSSANTATDGDTISELAGTVLTKNAAVQLYRNFIDCSKVEYLSTKDLIYFTQREHDIIAFAVLQARERRRLPGPNSKLSLTSLWGSVACDLMPYRRRKNLMDKFYVRQSPSYNMVDKLESVLANEEYCEHLEKHVAPLFNFMISKK